LKTKASIWLGFDPREAAAFAVARSSMKRHLNLPIPIRGLMLDQLRAEGLYTRPTERRDGRLWDVISGAPMATEFACSRFAVPFLAKSGWALFADCDVMAMADLSALFDYADSSKAVMCVKHQFEPPAGVKMDGQAQLPYLRKNWSSVCLWNVEHPSNRKLTLEMINTVPGRDLHAFRWLKDEEIGELPATFNYLVGHTQGVDNPTLVHFTDGIPSIPGYEDCENAQEWRDELQKWAA